MEGIELASFPKDQTRVVFCETSTTGSSTNSGISAKPSLKHCHAPSRKFTTQIHGVPLFLGNPLFHHGFLQRARSSNMTQFIASRISRSFPGYSTAIQVELPSSDKIGMEAGIGSSMSTSTHTLGKEIRVPSKVALSGN